MLRAAPSNARPAGTTQHCEQPRCRVPQHAGAAHAGGAAHRCGAAAQAAVRHTRPRHPSIQRSPGGVPCGAVAAAASPDHDGAPGGDDPTHAAAVSAHRADAGREPPACLQGGQQRQAAATAAAGALRRDSRCVLLRAGSPRFDGQQSNAWWASGSAEKRVRNRSSQTPMTATLSASRTARTCDGSGCWTATAARRRRSRTRASRRRDSSSSNNNNSSYSSVASHCPQRPWRRRCAPRRPSRKSAPSRACCTGSRWSGKASPRCVCRVCTHGNRALGGGAAGTVHPCRALCAPAGRSNGRRSARRGSRRRCRPRMRTWRPSCSRYRSTCSAGRCALPGALPRLTWEGSRAQDRQPERWGGGRATLGGGAHPLCLPPRLRRWSW